MEYYKTDVISERSILTYYKNKMIKAENEMLKRFNIKKVQKR